MSMVWRGRRAGGAGESITATSFQEDLAWQALQAAVVRVVLCGSGDIFKAVARSGDRAEQVARLVVEQITTFGFGEAQHLIRTGELRSLRDSVVAAVQQAATTGAVMVGGLMARSFLDRLGAARGALTVDGERRLQELEAERAQVAQDFEAARNGTADPEPGVGGPRGAGLERAGRPRRRDAARGGIPAGSQYHLSFIRDPGPDGRRRMLEILLPAGGRIAGVHFGPEPPPGVPQR
ncbi:hypothetical protein ACGF5C_12095 [Micromonospora sp. NPDC047620]|uniref:hypothetical protein n=1 Tax=Micromonospora sp. NPDC047620 TaxID=3364251 RepID=UPI003721B50E